MRVFAMLAIVLGLAACAETGDFGRPTPNLYSQKIAPLVGTTAALVRGEPGSFSMLTDDEAELRNRAYRFLMPAADRSVFDRQLAELTASRVLPRDLLDFDETAYFQALWLRGDRSPRSRYQSMREDMEGDRLLLGQFVALSCRVKETDRIRVAAMAQMSEVAEIVRWTARNRVEENEELVRWVYENVDRRLRAYRFALQNITVETPDRDAVKVERELIAFDSDRAGLDRCASRKVTVEVGNATPRYTPRPEKPELPPK